MQQMQMLVPLTKIDQERRLVFGRAVQEVPDKSGEILDYATAKPAFEQWSKHFEQVTGGLSKGNLRVMHKKDAAAGKIVDLSFNDAEKAVDICAKVVDDQEWKKVLEGIYTGFSVGGSYAKKWKDGDLTRYTPRVAEISLVDSPCIPTCRIVDLVKADGTVDQIELWGRPRSYREIAVQQAPTYAVLAKQAPPTYGDLAKARPSSVPSFDARTTPGSRRRILNGSAGRVADDFDRLPPVKARAPVRAPRLGRTGGRLALAGTGLALGGAWAANRWRNRNKAARSGA
jgi:hypothetical protein